MSTFNVKGIIDSLENVVKSLEEGVEKSKKRSRIVRLLDQFLGLIASSPGPFLGAYTREPAIGGFISAYSILRDIHVKISSEKELEDLYKRLDELLVFKAEPIMEAIKNGKKRETIIMKVEEFLNNLKEITEKLNKTTKT